MPEWSWKVQLSSPYCHPRPSKIGLEQLFQICTWQLSACTAASCSQLATVIHPLTTLLPVSYRNQGQEKWELEERERAVGGKRKRAKEFFIKLTIAGSREIISLGLQGGTKKLERGRVGRLLKISPSVFTRFINTFVAVFVYVPFFLWLDFFMISPANFRLQQHVWNPHIATDIWRDFFTHIHIWYYISDYSYLQS